MRPRLSGLALLLGVILAAPVAAQDVPAPTGLWVTDLGNFLSSEEEGILSSRLAGFADTTSTQIIVVTVPDLGGAAPSDYATTLGRAWGVGQGDKDNGVVVLVSRDDRQVFIATGLGLEGAIPDVLAGRIVRDIMVPAFRNGNFYDGISGAVDKLMLAASGEYTVDDTGGGEGIPLEVLVIVFIVVVIIVIAISAASNSSDGDGGRRYRHSSGPVIIWGGGGWGGGRSSGWGGGGGFGGGGFGGFSGGGGGFGGGGAGGGW